MRHTTSILLDNDDQFYFQFLFQNVAIVAVTLK